MATSIPTGFTPRPDPHYLTTAQVARELHVTADTVAAYCRDGSLPGAVKASSWRIPQAAVDAFKQWVGDGSPAGGPTL